MASLICSSRIVYRLVEMWCDVVLSDTNGRSSHVYGSMLEGMLAKGGLHFLSLFVEILWSI